MKNKQKGITLVALVITIIVLLILAGVSINLIMGNEGIIGKSETAVNEHEKATATETINFKITNVQIDTYAKEQRMPTLKELADEFCEDDDFQYVEESSRVASLDKIKNENPTSIYTKLKAYPYEFEINSDLQLASVDGVKVENNTNNGVISTSTKIKSVSCEVVQNKGVLDVTINPTMEDGVNELEVFGYLILCNNKVIEFVKTKTYSISNITPNTEYNISIIAIDNEAGMAKSQEVKIQSADKVYNSEALGYPILTLKGMMNAKYVCETDSTDYYYGFDSTHEATASGVLSINAYDNDFESYQLSTGNDRVKYFQVASECWGKYITIYSSSSSSSFGHLYFGTSYAGQDKLAASLQTLTGIDSNTKCARSVLIPEGSYWGMLSAGTSGVEFKLYEVWCSQDNLTGTTY